MALDPRDSTFFGPALPEPFVKFELEKHLKKRKLLPRPSKALNKEWVPYQRKLKKLGTAAGERKVFNHVLELLARPLGYSGVERADAVTTREGPEDGGWLMTGGSCVDDAGDEHAVALRCWAWPVETDLDAPSRRGRAYRFSPNRVAQRVLLARGERVGLLTNGDELRILICDPARPESHIGIPLQGTGKWCRVREAPDSYRLLKALCCPAGTRAVAGLTEAARLAQTGVTDQLRVQAREAIEGFVQAVVDHPENQEARATWEDLESVAHQLWSEGLVLVYRLLFTLKLETDPNPARAFSFASRSLWRHTYSPNQALAPIARRALQGEPTGRFLEDGLRTLFKAFSIGLSSSELTIAALGGMLFGPESTPLLDRLHWGEVAVATLLDKLLWTPGGRAERERVHYGALNVEDLGRVYEALLELESGIAAEPMCRLRRNKLEVVVPDAQGAPYRKGKRKKSKVEWVEDIPAGRFFLRVGLGRKASGSYYTPEPFVRFLVEETLLPQIEERSPTGDPQPLKLLDLKVLDPAMGSGHFLVEACRYVGGALYESCRLCDEKAAELAAAADAAQEEGERERLRAEAEAWWDRIRALPDPDDALMAYLPSRVAEGERSGYSQPRAEAICRRLVAVHCLYGVDKNRLAVELARVALWLESYAEGLPLTFLEHRLMCGDSLTGPFFEQLFTTPRTCESVETLFAGKLRERLGETLAVALVHVQSLEATVGKSVADLKAKQAAKERLDAALAPFVVLARTWSGGVMLGASSDDELYGDLLEAVASGVDPLDVIEAEPALASMYEVGRASVPYDLVFPEIFHPGGESARSGGFTAVLGNPPWDTVRPLAKEFFAAFDLNVLDAPTKRERATVEERLIKDPAVAREYDDYLADIDGAKRVFGRLTEAVGKEAGGRSSGAVSDLWQVFSERGVRLLDEGGRVGLVLPSAFHANQGATGIRELFLKEMALESCFSFENRAKLFSIHRSFKFAPVVARLDSLGTRAFRCAFYLHDMGWLFEERESLTFSRSFVERTGGGYCAFLELREPADARVATKIFGGTESAGEVLDRISVRCGEEIHMSKGAHRFTPTEDILEPGLDPRDPVVGDRLRAKGFLVLHEGKTFHQFDDRWEEPPRYLVGLDDISDRAEWGELQRYYRLAFRDISSSTNERTGIFTVLPPGVLCGNTAPVERSPQRRANSSVLALVGVLNSYVFDWVLRLKASTHVNAFVLRGCPLASLGESGRRMVAHGALRLVCNHEGFASLWQEQLGISHGLGWPVVEGEEERWEVRAAIDAVVADAYGLSREEYEHVLSSFNHRSFPRAPRLCLMAFDELRSVGVDAFSRRCDPYQATPLVSELAKPVLGGACIESTPSEGGAERLIEGSGQVQLLGPDNGPLFRKGKR